MKKLSRGARGTRERRRGGRVAERNWGLKKKGERKKSLTTTRGLEGGGGVRGGEAR